MDLHSRRDFHAKLLGSAITFGLIEALWARDLFADGTKTPIAKWLRELHELTQDLRGRQLSDLQFQAKMEELYARVDLPALIQLVDLDRLARSVKYPPRGAASLGFKLSQVEGLPAKLDFGKQIFAVQKGRSVVPHGHSNMCTGFIVLRGEFRGRHYDKLETHADHYLIKPTIDRAFKPGELSTISDHKDNVHWFEATTETGFIFNVHVIEYDPTITESSGRLYLDPDGEKLAGGLIKAKKMSSAECHKKYG
jgi:hypothetical protein